MAPPKLKGKTPATPRLKGVEWTASKDDCSLDTAVVYENVSSSNCGHAFRMDPLIDYLEKSTDSSTGAGKKKTTCPLCDTPVELVCDSMANTLQSQKNNDTEVSKKDNKVVTFKYRNHLYRLSVLRPSTEGLPLPYQLWFWAWKVMMEYCGETTSITAQERIAQVLNMDLHSGMKILHKGKIVYPNPRQSPHLVSSQILEVCDNGGKPLVMGTRLSERQQKMATVKWISTMLFSLMRAMLGKAIQIVQGIITTGKEFVLPLIAGSANNEHRD